MKKILIVLTNTTHYGDTNDATGLWLGEATEFAEEILNAGFEVDYVSPKGGFVPLDPRSMKYTDQQIMEFYETSDFKKRALSNSLRPDQIDPHEYAAIYYTGGHGVIWDFPNDPALAKIAETIYQDYGYITSVCHGIAGLFNLKDSHDHYLIENKKITGFTTTEEFLAGKKRIVPFLNQTMAEERGAIFLKKRAYHEFALQDGQLITGQNPFSARAVAQLLLKNLATQKTD